MAPIVEGAIDNLVSKSSGETPLHIVAEIPAAVGIVDLLAIEFCLDGIALRDALSLEPICSPLRIRVLDLLSSNRIKRVETLAKQIGSPEASLRRSTLEPLAEIGLLELSGKKIQSTGLWTPLGETIIAIELKLDKWRSALRQADNFSLSADHSWVVLDQERSQSAQQSREAFKTTGVGLATTDSDGQLKIFTRPKKRPPVRWLKALIAERAWAAFCDASEQAKPRIQERTPDSLFESRGQCFPKRNGAFESCADGTPSLA
jgi:hypothetical protein